MAGWGVGGGKRRNAFSLVPFFKQKRILQIE